MFLYLVTCFQRVTISLLCRFQAVSEICVPIYIPIKLVTGDEIVQPCNRHNNKTATLRIRVAKYKHMQKLAVEFPRTFENRGIKIGRVNLILITKSINLL